MKDHEYQVRQTIERLMALGYRNHEHAPILRYECPGGACVVAIKEIVSDPPLARQNGIERLMDVKSLQVIE